jgi:3-phenylpropionate/trans-cinnamate dioxygenase ferredoxin component
MPVVEWMRAAKVSNIAPDTAHRVEIGDAAIAIWNVEGQFYATDDECTHEETSLSEGDVWGGVVECPLHGAQFDVRTGDVLSLPAVFPLKTYPVKVEGDQVYVQYGP